MPIISDKLEDVNTDLETISEELKEVKIDLQDTNDRIIIVNTRLIAAANTHALNCFN